MKTIKTIKFAVQRGFSLLELTVVLIVIFGLLGLGYSAGQYLFSDLNAVGELSELPKVMLNIKKAKKDSPNFAGLTIDELARSGAFPENRVTIPGSGSATATNQWGGAVTLTIGTISLSNDIARLVSNSVPKAECVNVANGVGKMLRRMYIDSNNSGTAGAGTLVKADGAQVNTAAVSTACGTTNSITYDIGKS